LEKINKNRKGKFDEAHQKILEEMGLKKLEDGVITLNYDGMPIRKSKENTEEAEIKRLELKLQILR